MPLLHPFLHFTKRPLYRPILEHLPFPLPRLTNLPSFLNLNLTLLTFFFLTLLFQIENVPKHYQVVLDHQFFVDKKLVALLITVIFQYSEL